VQQKIYDMIVRRFISGFFPAAQFEVTTRITAGGEDAFRTDGKVIKIRAGLRLRTRAASEQEGGESLVAITPNEAAKVLDIELRPTKPSRRRDSTKHAALSDGRSGQIV